jgi:hypothetical protein
MHALKTRLREQEELAKAKIEIKERELVCS